MSTTGGVDPLDRRSHTERINPPKEAGMTEEQLRRLMAHIAEQLAPIRQASEEALKCFAEMRADRARHNDPVPNVGPAEHLRSTD
jgi:phage I-like protein